MPLIDTGLSTAAVLVVLYAVSVAHADTILATQLKPLQESNLVQDGLEGQTGTETIDSSDTTSELGGDASNAADVGTLPYGGTTLGTVDASGPIDGTVVAASFDQDGALYGVPTQGLVPVGVLTPVPEPASIALLAGGLIGLAALRRRNRRRRGPLLAQGAWRP